MSFSEPITNLLAEAAKVHSQKDYDKAVELYGEACAKYQEESKGTESADLLYLYGKALYELAVSNSEVLGGQKQAPVEQNKVEEKLDDSRTFQFDEGVVDEGDEEEEEEEEEKEEEEEEEEEEEKDDGNQTNEQDNEEAEETDFEAAWNILDLARYLFEEQLEKLDETKPKEKIKEDESPTEPALGIKKKLADTYDILGEVSLEAENYSQASKDFEKSLELRNELYEDHSPLISESYYKLSLCYEFLVDQPGSREQAAKYMEKSIQAVEKNPDTDKNGEVLAELKERLEDLKRDPLKEEKEKIMKGLLGEVLEEQKKEQKQNVEKEASVNDLTLMVKKRKGPKVMRANKKAKN